MTDKSDYIRNIRNPDLASSIKSYMPRPSDKDYKHGEMIRYFARQTNHSGGEVTEISKQQSDAIKYKSLFITTSIRWKISGSREEVRNFNTITTEMGSEKMPEIINTLTNPLQFWRG